MYETHMFQEIQNTAHQWVGPVRFSSSDSTSSRSKVQKSSNLLAIIHLKRLHKTIRKLLIEWTHCKVMRVRIWYFIYILITKQRLINNIENSDWKNTLSNK